MVILVCPASFKGVLSAPEAARAMAAAVEERGHRALTIPLADGGEGTLDALLSRGGERHAARVEGPYGEEVEAEWGTLPDGTAVVEMAQASGLARAAGAKRDLFVASSFGTGQLLSAALASSPRRLVVGIGGSATNDGGAGAMRALGARFLDAAGRALADAGSLSRLETIQAPPVPGGTSVVVASDVDNRLTGPEGATRMFGRQKGGTPEALDVLEGAMVRYGEVLSRTFGWDVASAPGAGAAGGMGAALLGFLKARFQPGIDVVMDALGFDGAAQEAEVLLTGEGRLDAQSLHGKTIAGVLRRAHGKRVMAVCGRVDLPEAQWRAWGLAAVHATSPEHPPATHAEAVASLRRATLAAF